MENPRIFEANFSRDFCDSVQTGVSDNMLSITLDGDRPYRYALLLCRLPRRLTLRTHGLSAACRCSPHPQATIPPELVRADWRRRVTLPPSPPRRAIGLRGG